MTDRSEWLLWRKLGIGSSDAACVHDESPYMTRHELGEVKLQKEYIEGETNFAMSRGVEREPIIRSKFAAIYNIENNTDESFEPMTLVMSEYPFMRCSLDGISKDGKTITEFKVMGAEKHLAVLEGIAPRHYWIQAQHQLLVSGAEVCYFASEDMTGKTLHHTKILPDTEFMKSHLELCSEFWALVEAGKSQPLSNKDFKELKGCSHTVRRWKELKQLIETSEKELESIRNEILLQVTHPRMRCEGVRIVKQPGRPGAIDYARMIKEINFGVDLEKYRKPNGTEFWKMEIE